MRKAIGRCLMLIPTLLWVIVVCYYEGLYTFLGVTLAACFHECGHLFAFSALGLPAPRIVPVARGVRLSAEITLGYRQELIVALAGPVANFSCAAVGMLYGKMLPWLSDFGEISLMTALCNLVPMAKLDGERILTCLLAPRISARTLYLCNRILSSLTLYISLFGSLSMMWISGSSIYPSVLCFCALLSAPMPFMVSRGKESKQAIL